MNNLSFRGHQSELLKYPLSNSRNGKRLICNSFLSFRPGRRFVVAIKCNAQDTDASISKATIIIILLLTLCYLVFQVVKFRSRCYFMLHKLICKSL